MPALAAVAFDFSLSRRACVLLPQLLVIPLLPLQHPHNTGSRPDNAIKSKATNTKIGEKKWREVVSSEMGEGDRWTALN